MNLLKKINKFLLSILKKKKKPTIRKDVCRIDVQEDVYFNVYWKILKIGKGPAVTLNIYNKEILKFDCFGKCNGHFHISPEHNKRIFFSEQTAKDQIERTSFELTNNLNIYLGMNEEKKVREISIDCLKLKLAVERVEEKMTHFLETVTEIQGI